ncbi:MAG: transposase [Candidatus Adiutrix sp.]|nr:transposase [Candidatus Adiutrix sp.]
MRLPWAIFNFFSISRPPQPVKAVFCATLGGHNAVKYGSGPPRLQASLRLCAWAKPCRKCRFGILNWYDHTILSGPLEGANNKIKTLKRPAYRFRDLDFI